MYRLKFRKQIRPPGRQAAGSLFLLLEQSQWETAGKRPNSFSDAAKPMTTDTSRSLLDRLQTANSAEDWNVFFQIYQPFIRRHLLTRKIVIEDVDDVTQEILSRVFRSFSSFAHNGRRGAFRNWLGQIVSQQTWRYFQRMQKQPVVSLMAPEQFEEFVPATGEMESRWEAEHDRYLLGRLLELIKPEFAESTWHAFLQVAIRNVSVETVARNLGLSVNAVVIAKSRVLRRLRILGKDLLDNF